MCQRSCPDEGTGEFSHSKHPGAPLQIKSHTGGTVLNQAVCMSNSQGHSDLINVSIYDSRKVNPRLGGLWCEILNNTDAHWL